MGQREWRRRIQEAGRLLVERARPAEALQRLQGVPRAFLEKDPRALYLLGFAHLFLGHLEEARYFLERLRTTPGHEADALLGLGLLEIERGRVQEGIRRLQEAEARYPEDDPNRPAVWNHLLRGYWYLGQLDRALAAARRTAEEAARRGLFHLVASARANEAVILSEKGDLLQGIRRSLEALNLARRLDATQTVHILLLNLAEFYLEAGLLDRALPALQDLQSFLPLMAPQQAAQYHLLQAQVALIQNRKPVVRRHLEEALTRALEVDIPRIRAEVHLFRALFAYSLGLVSESRQEIQEALACWTVSSSPLHRCLQTLQRLLEGRAIDPNQVVRQMQKCGEDLWLLPVFVAHWARQEHWPQVFQLLEAVAPCLQQGRRTGVALVFWELLREAVQVYLQKRARTHEAAVQVWIRLGIRDPVFLRRLLQGIAPAQVFRFLKEAPVFPPEVFRIFKDLQLAHEPAYEDLSQAYAVRNPLRIQTLGTFQVWRGPWPVSSTLWRRPFVRELFKFLLVHRNRWLDREFLLESLWPGEDPRRSSARLRVYLSYLREALEPWLRPQEASTYLWHEGGKYGLFLDEAVELDAEAFERSVRAGLQARREGRSARAEDLLRRALRLYAGDFLPENRYEGWVLQERHRLRQQYAQALEALLGLLRQQGRETDAGEPLLRAFFLDPADERFARWYLAWLNRQGRPQDLQRMYDLHSQAVRERYGDEPVPLERLLEPTGP